MAFFGLGFLGEKAWDERGGGNGAFVDGRKGGRTFKLLEGTKEKEKEAVVFWSCVDCTSMEL